MGTQSLNDRRANTDVVLTKLSLGIGIDQDFIGSRILPPLSQKLSVAKIPVWGNEAFRVRDDNVGDYSEPDKLDISIDTTTFEVDGHALMAPVSRRHQIESAQGPLQVDLDAEALQTIKSSMALAKEKLQADLVTSPSIYTASHKEDLNALGTQWSDPAVDPLTTIINATQNVLPDDSGKMPNTLWMGQQVWSALIQNPLMRNRIFGQLAPQGIPTEAQIANLFGVQRLLIGRAVSKTVTGSITKLWGKSAGLVYVPPTSGKRIPAFGYTVEQQVFGSSNEAVIRFPDEKMGASGGDWIKRSEFYTPVVLFPASGFLFFNAVA